MMLSNDNKTLAESKLIILYILNKINKPIENEALLKLVLSITDMNYFYFQQFLLDLLNTNYINCVTEENEAIYSITQTGREVLELTKNIIPGLIKFKIDNDFKESLDQIKNEFSVTAEFEPIDENDYTVKCKIIEDTKLLFELQTFAGSSEQAKHMVNNWKNNANIIYPKILEILSADYSSERKIIIIIIIRRRRRIKVCQI